MIVLVMGVAGAGKTTIGTLLARELGWTFADADSYHSPANIAKMASGVPLTDEDRVPWLIALRDAIRGWIAAGENAVLACSALKQAYRDVLMISPEVKLVYLRGSFDLINQRLRQRHGHYMHAMMLRSQFETLEEPKDAVIVDVAATPEEIVGRIRREIFPDAVGHL